MSDHDKKSILQVEAISKIYTYHGRKQIKALDHVSFSLKAGRCLGIVGESGCGKSTLCRLIAGVEKPSDGRILFESVRKNGLSRDVQMVFQNSLDAVNLHLQVSKIISEPLENFRKMKRSERREEVGNLLETVGLSREEIGKYPLQFSGGQLQRVCIARALAAQPKLLLLDEPLSSLDVSIQAQLLNLLLKLKSELNLTYILVSHDLKAVYYLADELLVMYDGCVMEQISDIADFSELCHPYTKCLLDASNLKSTKENAMFSTEKKSEKMGCIYAGCCGESDALCRVKRPGLVEWKSGHKIACHHRK